MHYTRHARCDNSMTGISWGPADDINLIALYHIVSGLFDLEEYLTTSTFLFFININTAKKKVIKKIL